MIFVNALFLRAFIYAHTPAQLTTGRNAVMLVCFTTASVKILGRYVGSGGRNSEAVQQKAEAAGKVHRARVVLQAQHSRPQEHAAQRHAQQGFKRQPSKAARRDPVFAREQLDEKV